VLNWFPTFFLFSGLGLLGVEHSLDNWARLSDRLLVGLLDALDLAGVVEAEFAVGTGRFHNQMLLWSGRSTLQRKFHSFNNSFAVVFCNLGLIGFSVDLTICFFLYELDAYFIRRDCVIDDLAWLVDR
jgi:hypothetical protein